VADKKNIQVVSPSQIYITIVNLIRKIDSPWF